MRSACQYLRSGSNRKKSNLNLKIKTLFLATKQDLEPLYGQPNCFNLEIKILSFQLRKPGSAGRHQLCFNLAMVGLQWFCLNFIGRNLVFLGFLFLFQVHVDFIKAFLNLVYQHVSIRISQLLCFFVILFRLFGLS